jgi:hypothetical protein
MRGTPRRSVSPFGTFPETEAEPLAPLARAIEEAFGPPPEQTVRKFTAAAHIAAVPARLKKAFDAPANDAPWLGDLCGFLVRMRPDLEEKNVNGAVWTAMSQLFERKTDVFLLDLVETPDGRPTVLFSRERDALVGRFFAGWTEREPGLFSGFIDGWTNSGNPDRLMHFLDFCAGSKNPTFEHYLLFTHPALHRWVSNKAQLRALFERVDPLLAKMKAGAWASAVKDALGI